MTPRPIPPFAVLAGEGTAKKTPNSDILIKADTGMTNGSMTVIEILVPPKEGPALHTHIREDELWYVLSGDFRFKAGGELLEASTGGMAFGPRGTPHAFQNVGDSPGRLLVVTTPSGLERFFEQLDELLPGPVDPAAFAAVGHANWVEIIGPPLGVSDPL